MKKLLLYYPGAVPSLHWLTGSILYADGLLSIFPNEAFYTYLVQQHKNSRTDTDSETASAQLSALRYLIDEALFEPILASDFIDETYLTACTQELSELLRSDASAQYNRLLLTAYDRLTKDRVVGSVTESNTFALLSSFVTDTYQGQINTAPNAMFSPHLIDEAVWLLLRLVREGFSQRGRQVIPSTDDYDFTNLIFQHSANDLASVRLVLNKCVPIPDSEVSIETVVSFKRRNSELLQQFYRATNEFQVDLLQIDTDDDVVALLYRFEQTITTLTDAISHALTANGIRHRRASWSTLLSLNASLNHRLFARPDLANQPLTLGNAPSRKRRVKLVDTRVTSFMRQTNRIGGLELSQLLE